jgi:ABC-type branched-subunit amino acid transport system substrate-binding protein
MGIRIIILLLFAFVANISFAQQAIVVQDMPLNHQESKVLIMLPFSIGTPDQFRLRDKMLDYYEGVEMAIEELKKLGIKMSVEIVDTKGDSLEIINILSNPDYQNCDLIIGPVLDKELVEVEKFCAIYNIALVSPLRYYSKKTGAEFPLINLIPNDTIQYQYIGYQAAKAFKNFQVVVLDEQMNTVKGHASRNFKKGYDNYSKKNCQIINGKTQTIANTWNQKDSLLIFYTGKNSSSCSNGISNAKNNKCIVMGPADWIDIDRVDYNVFNGIYFYDAYSVPHNDTTFKQIRKTYRTTYGGDPQRYTLIGYDQFLYLGTALAAFESRFLNHILNKKFNYLHSSFQLVTRGNLIENSGINFFYYKDYQFYKSYWRY